MVRILWAARKQEYLSLTDPRCYMSHLSHIVRDPQECPKYFWPNLGASFWGDNHLSAARFGLSFGHKSKKRCLSPKNMKLSDLVKSIFGQCLVYHFSGHVFGHSVHLWRLPLPCPWCCCSCEWRAPIILRCLFNQNLCCWETKETSHN